jgi:PTH1 family peptidyl-tRNA hydrolase
MTSFLIVGLGNPGKTYEKTRHNIGWRAVQRLAERHSLAFRKKLLLRGRVAHGPVKEKNVYLLLPETYMNLSGGPVARMMKKHAIPIERVLVLVDDVAIPFGDLRMRAHSGTGGHKGLQSIEECLGSNGYPRLRIGVGEKREAGDLASYVLAPFTPDEEKLVPEILERAATTAESWLIEGLTSAVNHLKQ